MSRTVRTSGVLITTPLDGGPEVHEDTVQCVHCQAHRPVRASTRWGFCGLCGGPHCATDACAACVPAEKWLDWAESGKLDLSEMPIVVAVPEVPPCR